MTIIEFVEKYKATTGETLRAKLIKGIIKTDPIGIAAKASIARDIAVMTSEKNGKFHVDTIKRFYLVAIALLQNYTTLKIDPTNGSVEYDLLNDSGALEDIMTAIPDKEKSELNTMIAMACDDYVQNHMYVPNAFLGALDDMIPILDKLLTNENSDKNIVDATDKFKEVE